MQSLSFCSSFRPAFVLGEPNFEPLLVRRPFSNGHTRSGAETIGASRLDKPGIAIIP
jgi:hypothetical protein